MGKRQQSFGPLSPVPSATLNAIQDYGLNGRPQDNNTDLVLTNSLGIDSALIVTNTSVANGNLLLLDASIDWRDRVIEGALFRMGATTPPGQSQDYQFDDFTGLNVGSEPRFFGYLGSGAYSNTATSAAVSAGNAPVKGAGVVRSYCVAVVNGGTLNAFLYAAPSDGKLYIYNASGAGWLVAGIIRATGKLGKR